MASIVLSPSSHRRRPRLGSALDSVFAIGLGLGLRVVLDVVLSSAFPPDYTPPHDTAHSYYDSSDEGALSMNTKISTAIIGVWEGIVVYHFLHKWPKSLDPYIAYGVRLFVDLLVTESMTRLALVLLWTGLGVILADVGPAIYRETGLKKAWYRLRRDISYTIPSMLPKTALPTRVRFREVPPQASASALSRSRSTTTSISPSDISASYSFATRTTQPPVPIPVPRNQRRPSRYIPGSFPDDISETETAVMTERGSIRTVDLPPLPPSVASSSRSSAASSVSSELEYADDPRPPRPESRDLTEIPEVLEDATNASRKAPSSVGIPADELTPRRRSVLLPSDIPTRPSSKVEVQPPIDEMPVIKDPNSAEDGWDEIDKTEFDIQLGDTRTSTPPPPFADEYGNIRAPTNDADLVSADLLGPHPPPRDKNGLTIDPSMLPNTSADSNRDSILSTASRMRLTSALEMRKELAQMIKRKNAVEFERKQALSSNKRMLALTKKQEYERLIKEIKAMETRISRKVFDVHNKSLPPSLINISDLTSQAAIERVEEALERLLQPPPPPAQDDASALLSFVPTANVGEYITGPKTLTVIVNDTITGEERDVLEEVKAALEEFNFTIKNDPNDPNSIVIELPKAG